MAPFVAEQEGIGEEYSKFFNLMKMTKSASSPALVLGGMPMENSVPKNRIGLQFVM